MSRDSRIAEDGGAGHQGDPAPGGSAGVPHGIRRGEGEHNGLRPDHRPQHHLPDGGEEAGTPACGGTHHRGGRIHPRSRAGGGHQPHPLET